MERGKKVRLDDVGYLAWLEDRMNLPQNPNRLFTSSLFRKTFKISDSYVAARMFHSLASGKRSIRAALLASNVLETAQSSEERKLKFLFDLHDADSNGFISKFELKKMLDASLRQNELQIDAEEKKLIVTKVFQKVAPAKRRGIDFSEFKKLLKAYPHIQTQLLSSVSHALGAENFIEHDSELFPKRRMGTTLKSWFKSVPRVVYRMILVAVFLGINAFLAYNAFVEYGQKGATLAVQIARACGAMLNFAGALILFPVMKNLVGALRKTFLRTLLPLDHAIEIHRFLGIFLLLVGLVHTAAHTYNYTTLQVSLETSFFQTLGGLSGIVVLGILLVMATFAQKSIRRSKFFEWFSLSHGLYFLWFVSMLIHAPNFWKWAAAPLILYVIDWSVQRFRKRYLSTIESARVLPGQVTEIVVKRNARFRFQSGDYLYLKIPAVSRLQWHPFTISSAPETTDRMSLHIRKTGNWTGKLHDLVEKNSKPKDLQLPVFYSGPYGTPSNLIFQSKHVVLVGAGIGVTPFASVMKSILHRQQNGLPMAIEKLHFIWLNRGQKSFEWFGDLLAEMEGQFKRGFFNLRIYMTNAQVSLSSGLVRIGMELVRKETQFDMTTGLKSLTQFGRPNWNAVFSEISEKKGKTANVFFCGPHALAQEVKKSARYFGFGFRKENF